MEKINIDLILRRYNPWWEKKYAALGIKRESYCKKIEENLNNNQIIFITGLRRIGKTTIIKQFIERLIEDKKINPLEILFVSLDDPALTKISLNEIIDSFRKINLLKFDRKIYLFFDEISYKDNFSQELKSINDNQNVKIFTSGSNALELMDKKAFLTGRVFNIKIYPLNFEEFLEFNKLKFNPVDKHLEERYFEEFLKTGGVPEYVLTKNPDFITTLVEDIIYKDISRAYNIKNTEKLKETFMLLCERVGKKISYNKLSKILGIDKETIAEYISHFQNTFLFTIIQKNSKSLNDRVYSEKKIYISDNGIRNIFVEYKDKGSLFENYVFNELSKRFKKISYYCEDNLEIDFVLKIGTKEEIAIESKYNENADLKKYENKFSKLIVIKNYKELMEFISQKRNNKLYF